MEENLQRNKTSESLGTPEDNILVMKNSDGVEILIKIENGIAISYKKRTLEKKYLPENGVNLKGLGNIINFSFITKDTKELLKIETEYMDYYFLKNQKQYISQKGELEKLKELFLSSMNNILEYGINKLNLPFIFPTQTKKGSNKEYLKFDKEK